VKQLAETDQIRRQLRDLSPRLDELKDALRAVLNKTPPDGTIGSAQYDELRAIQHALQDLLLAQKFDTRGR
jgi:hypothetical protein